MFLPTSVNDPVFFLHHANIDRLWAEWQDAHGIDSYEPHSCGESLLEPLLEPGCAANTRNDRMYPPFDATPADVADLSALGYRYDTSPVASRSTSRAGRAARPVTLAAFRCAVGR
jgi:tyrosinase